MLSAGSPHSWAMPRSRWGVPPPWGGKSSDRRPGGHARRPKSPKKSQGPETESHGPWRGERSLLNPHEDFAKSSHVVAQSIQIFLALSTLSPEIFLSPTRKLSGFHTLAFGGALSERARRFRALFLGCYRRYACAFKRTVSPTCLVHPLANHPIIWCVRSAGRAVFSACRDARCPCPLACPG
jgi:hypothetical protein